MAAVEVATLPALPFTEAFSTKKALSHFHGRAPFYWGKIGSIAAPEGKGADEHGDSVAEPRK